MREDYDQIAEEVLKERQQRLKFQKEFEVVEEEN